MFEEAKILYGLMIKHELYRLQIEEAAKLANAHDFISSFPMGYQTMVGERGMNISPRNHSIASHSILFCSILFWSVLFCSVLLYSIV